MSILAATIIAIVLVSLLVLGLNAIINNNNGNDPSHW